MEFDFKKIAKAWIDSYIGSDRQKELAVKRTSICETCPSRIVVNEPTGLLTRCKECGCPIKKKVFSDDFNDCPLKKWEAVDSKYFLPRKEVKTLF
jgi:hypothetical protein